MTTITLLDLRKDLQQIGKLAAQGEVFSVTYRGNPMFNITPTHGNKIKEKPKNAALQLLETVEKIEKQNKNKSKPNKVLSDEEFYDQVYQDKVKKYLI